MNNFVFLPGNISFFHTKYRLNFWFVCCEWHVIHTHTLPISIRYIIIIIILILEFPLFLFFDWTKSKKKNDFPFSFIHDKLIIGTKKILFSVFVWWKKQNKTEIYHNEQTDKQRKNKIISLPVDLTDNFNNSVHFICDNIFVLGFKIFNRNKNQLSNQKSFKWFVVIFKWKRNHNFHLSNLIIISFGCFKLVLFFLFWSVNDWFSSLFPTFIKFPTKKLKQKA